MTGDDADPGTVYLVGSGPGDPDLLTVRARRLLAAADAVLHDKLPGPDVLAEIPADRREDVGSRGHGEATSQAYINERLVELALEGKTVVRLKGGDPTVFGRAGEEMRHLAEHDVPFEVVPGVTSAVAAPAVAGIPVTHRDVASSVSVVTGHEDPDKAESAVDWEALAATGGTIVVLMGVRRLPAYTAALIDAGMDPETPAALVERATWPAERVATGTLETIVAARDEAGIEPPAVAVIGEVAALREEVLDAMGEDRPAVAVFRPDDDRLDAAIETLESLGLAPVADPMLAVESTGATPKPADYVVLTSRTGAELVAEAGWDPGGATVVAIGDSTADALERAGYPVDVTPAEFSSRGLVERLRDEVSGAAVEVARSDHGSPVLLEGLREAGATVQETVLYRLTRPPAAGDSAEAAAAGDLDGAAFTSSLTVEHFLAAADERGVRDAAVAGLGETVVGAIGEPTRETATAEGIDVDVVPETADFEVLARALAERLRGA